MQNPRRPHGTPDAVTAPKLLSSQPLRPPWVYVSVSLSTNFILMASLKCFHVIFTVCLFVWWNKPLLGFMITICDKKIIMISVWTLHVTDQLLLPASTFVRIGISRFLRRVWARRLLVFLHNMSFRRRDYCKSRVLQIRGGWVGVGGCSNLGTSRFLASNFPLKGANFGDLGGILGHQVVGWFGYGLQRLCWVGSCWGTVESLGLVGLSVCMVGSGLGLLFSLSILNSSKNEISPFSCCNMEAACSSHAPPQTVRVRKINFIE